MDRRILGAGLAAALATSALAQQGPVSPIPANPVPAETQPNPPLATPQDQRQQRLQMPGAPQDTGVRAQQGAPPRQAQAGPQSSPADSRQIEQTLAAGTVTLQASTLARTKAQNERVKSFAAAEEAEQNTLFEVLHSLADPATTASTDPRTTQAAPAAATAPVISDQGAAAMERMSRAGPGPEFDRDYVRLQIDGHQEQLAIQDRYLAGAPQNREQVAIAKLARGQIREHLARLEDIRRELGQ
jgi:putative membrane protein